MSINRFCLRPIVNKDLTGLYELSLKSGSGLSNLPKDMDVLARMIEASESAFYKVSSLLNRDALYLFVLEHLETRSIIGLCGLRAGLGVLQPSYLITLKKQVCDASDTLKSKTHHRLQLKQIKNGPSVLVAMFIDPDYRSLGLGRLCSLSRFLFIKQHPKRFKRSVCAELRGYHYKNKCPFWEEVLQPFFPMAYEQAISMMRNNTKFIKDYFPKSLILELLPKHIQALMGQTHPFTKGAKNILLKQGFVDKNQFCLFDLGPYLQAPLNSIDAFKYTKAFTQDSLDEIAKHSGRLLVSEGKHQHFRVYFENVNSDQSALKNARLKSVLNQQDALCLFLQDSKLSCFNRAFSAKQQKKQQLLKKTLQ